MTRRMAIGVVIGMLVLYTGAGLHQVLHHHSGHDEDKYCPLCVLLASPMLPAAVPAIQSVMPVEPAAPSVQVLPAASAPHGEILLRGPPLS